MISEQPIVLTDSMGFNLDMSAIIFVVVAIIAALGLMLILDSVAKASSSVIKNKPSESTYRPPVSESKKQADTIAAVCLILFIFGLADLYLGFFLKDGFDSLMWLVILPILALLFVMFSLVSRFTK